MTDFTMEKIADGADLERSDMESALATLCVASGRGAATIIERV
jgi:acetyl-CoA acetyltransferase